jgi:signal transduction histidine kinase
LPTRSNHGEVIEQMSTVDPLPPADSEMAARIRHVTWSTTTLGDPTTWCAALRNALALCLATSAPLQIWWGRSLTLLYNDAAIPSIASHPAALGRTVPDLLGERWSTMRSQVEQVFETGAGLEHLGSRLTPLFDADGSVAGIACTPDQVSARAEQHHLGNLASVLRTPLTMILAPLDELLASGEDPVSIPRDELETVHRAGLRIHKQVSALFDFLRIESDHAFATFEPTKLGALTRRIAEVWRPAIARTGLALELEVAASDDHVHVDPVLWETIVDSLLSNALDHTLSGTIRVAFHVADGAARLTVEDTGIGIAPEHLPHVFARFYRAPDPRARKSEGAGLGLAVVRELVALHGGTIEAASEIDRGSRFTVTMKLGHEHLAPTQVQRELSEDPKPNVSTDENALHTTGTRHRIADGAGGRERPRVLLVDDNAELCEYLANVLREEWNVEVASNGTDALTIASLRPPDVIVADVLMAGLDGLDLARALRGHPRTSQTPIILATARSGDDARAAGLEAGANDYITKPFTTRELRSRMRSQLELARARSESTAVATRAKDDFLAMVGHELRNPLSTMATTLQALQLRGSTPEVELLSRAQRQLTRLVEDLLESSRLSRGMIELQAKVTELSHVLDRAVELVTPWFEDKHNQLSISVPREGLRIEADRARLARAISNVLMNASQYGSTGSKIRIEAQLTDGRVVLRIADDGAGIAPDRLSSVFTTFQQERRSGGLGLGLAIAQRVVELHHGSIAVYSDGVGKGTECRIQLPASGARAQAATTTEKVRKRLLLVEDTDDAARALKVALEQLGYEVALAHDAPIALNLAKTFRPDVVLLDLGLPVMDGWELAQRLRGTASELPIVAVTARDQDADKQRSAALGFAEHLVKPIDLVELERIVQSISSRSSGDAH